ncbi:MAG: hypothetical protein ACK49J_03415 [Verrucomicrobiota bacterium]
MSSDSTNDPGNASRDKNTDPSRVSDGSASLESELWNLDDEESSRPMPAELLGAVGEDIPPAKLSRVPRILSASFTEKKKPQVQVAPTRKENNGIKLNVKRNQDLRPAERPVRRVDFLREFGDLEQWADDGGKSTGREIDEAKNLATMETAAAPEEPVSNESPQAEAPEEMIVESTTVPVERASVAEPNEPESSEKAETPASSQDAVEAVETPVLKSHVKYSALEKFGMIALVILLLGAVAGILIYSATRLPVETVSSKVVKFPVKGKHVTVQSAKTYWRDVVTSGPDADIVRRGTRLLPVLDLNCSGGAGVLRVLFRDEFGDSVGDIITRQVSAGEKVSIASTAGFNDAGMHAAYRTGETKAWKIEVYEGSADNFSGNNFVKLFEIDISTERR